MMLVHQHKEETWQVEYSEGPSEPYDIYDGKGQVEVPDIVWIRLRLAEKALVSARAEIDEYFE